MSSPLLVDILAYWNLNDNGSGGVSLVDSTGNGYTLTNNNDVTLGAGIIDGGGVFSYADTSNLSLTPSPFTLGSSDFAISGWFNSSNLDPDGAGGSPTIISIGDWSGGSGNGFAFRPVAGGTGFQLLMPGSAHSFSYSITTNTWYYYAITRTAGVIDVYINGVSEFSVSDSSDQSDNSELLVGNRIGQGSAENWDGVLDEMGFWSRGLSPTEVNDLYNEGVGLTYPFLPTLYYNNAEADGDWGNLLNWWKDSGFTIQAAALPDNTNLVNLYAEVTQNTQGANQCFCYSASFWSANFGAGLTLQSTGVVNMQGTSIFAGTTTDGVSMHDSSQLTATSVVDGNVVMRDSSRAFGSILGNATIYYDAGNGQYPIGGTVAGSVTYIGWPAVSPQWFNDQATGGADDGDFANMANWWSNDTYTTRPINTVGYQQLPDASTDVFIAPDTGIYANTGDAILVNSITANNGYISNITLTVSNGIVFSGNGNYGTTNAIIYADVTFSGTAYNDGSAIHGNADYKSSTSLVESFNHNSLGNLTLGASRGSNSMTVTISGGGGTSLGTNWISRLLHLPWFINV